MKTIYLISCVSEKRASEAPAEGLYCSALFGKAREYVLRNIQHGDEWFILSAKYGLLKPEIVIGPYNETLNNMRKAARQWWAQKVLDELRSVVHPGDLSVFLAGLKYREFLESGLLELGCRVSVPMRGMGIGEQLKWLNHTRSL